jgi:NAD-specific glutamate dehydrogenase
VPFTCVRSTIGNSFIRVNALVGLLAVEEVGNKFDDAWDTSGTTDQDNLWTFVDLQVAESTSCQKKRRKKLCDYLGRLQ